VFFPASRAPTCTTLWPTSTRRQRLPRQPEPDDVADHAAALPGPLNTYRQREAIQPLGSSISALRPGRLADEEQLLADYASGSTCRCRRHRYANAVADAMTFMDENGDMVQYSTAKLPDPRSCGRRAWASTGTVFGNRNTQFRGGTGIFTASRYVWISNQIGNTGVLTGFEQFDTTTARPFSPDTERYKPATVTGAPASSFELALTDPNFKFPQVWRTSLGIDQRLPGGWVGTLEYIYSQDVNGTYYIMPTCRRPTRYVGADPRPRGWAPTATASTRRSRTPSC